MSEVRKDELEDVYNRFKRHYIALGKDIEDLLKVINSTCEVPEKVYNQEQEDESETISIR